MGDRVFNGLAHFIKGGIFFLYGVLTLGRWLGAFSELGWVGSLQMGISLTSDKLISIGVEYQAAPGIRQEMEIKGSHRRDDRVLGDFSLWRLKRLFGASGWMGRSLVPR
jgi:Protein of unknown function (Ytp1)